MLRIAYIGWVLTAAWAMSGCTNTYVDYPDLPVAKSGSFGQLREATTKLEALRIKQVQTPRNEEALYRKAMSALTFGALAGGGTAALYGAHRDLVLGFGLVGAGSYGLSNLYWSPERGRNLNSGNDALQCISRTGAGVLATDRSLETTKDRIDTLKTAISGCTAPGTTEAVAAANRAGLNLEAFRALDSTFASELGAAGSLVVKAMNKRLENFEATPAAAVRAAHAINQFATGFVSQAISTPVAGSGGRSGPIIGSMGCPSDSPAKATELKNLSKTLEETIASATNKMVTVAAQCVFEGEALQKLAASPNQINVAKDVTVTVTVTGAFGLPTVRWKTGTPPPANVMQVRIVGPDQILFEGKSGMTGGTAIEAEIIDQRPVATPVLVTIQPTG